MNLYSVDAKTRPEIWDKGTTYASETRCKDCNNQINKVVKLGAYLPNWAKPFGLISTINGMIGSEKSVQHLQENGIDKFSIEEAVVTFGQAFSDEGAYYWIKPNEEIELDVTNGPGPVLVCQKCGRRIWKEKNLTLPRFKEAFDSEILLVKYTWIVLVTEKFIHVAKEVSEGCYLDFQPWYFEG